MSIDTFTIRVSRSTHELLRALAKRSNMTIMAVVDQAARDLQRRQFWEDFNASCAAIQADDKAWAELQWEDAAWESTLADGLEEQPLEREPRRPKSSSG